MARLGINSATKVVQLASAALTDDVPLPAGVTLRDDSEMVIWRQFTRARACADWRDFDLIMVAKAVRLEADIRKHQEMLDKAGPLMKNPKGTPIANPLLSVIDTLQRQQLAVIRSLSLTQTASDPRVLNRDGAAQGKLRNTFDSFDDLIARPASS